ncbi:MAG: hypothetical protein GC179_12470 [Anaerolineaceae bacterium]|nr:hypothetical protein [Anaerolineaceae bacterium]
MNQAIRKITPHQILVIILVVKLFLGVFYVVQQPLWQYHEADFLRVARTLRDEGKLPVLADDAAPDTKNNSQPPLIYFMLLPFVAAMDDNQTVPAGINPTAVCDGYNTNLTSLVTTTAYDNPLRGAVGLGYALRLLSLATSLVAVVFTYLAGRVLFPQKPFIALLGAALMAFEPTSVIVASEINNDNLILALGAVHLWFCARLIHQRGTLAVNLVGLLVVAVLALLSKISGWLMLGISILLVLNVMVQMARQRASRRQKQVALGLGAFLIVAVIGVMVFNIAQYGSPLGRYRGLDKVIGNTLQNLPPQHVIKMTVATLQDTFSDYLSPVRSLQPPNILLVVYSGLLALVILAALYGIFQAIRRRDKIFIASFSLLVIYALLMVGLVIFRSILNNGTPDFVNTMLIISPVRYYAPALPALALIGAAGFSAFSVPKLSLAGSVIGAGTAACWFMVALVGLRIPLSMSQMRNSAVLSQAEFEALTNITPVQSSQDAGLPQILGYQIQTHADAGLIDLDVYVRANQPISDNYALQTDLTSGSQRTSCRTVPVRGLYPTPRWQPDKIIVLHNQIPNCVANRPTPIQMDVQWLQSTTVSGLASTQPSGSPIKLGSINDTLGVAASCPANLGMIGGGLQLLKFNSVPTVSVQAQPVYYVPSVNWLARNIPEDAYARVYVLIHNETGTVFTCAGFPRQDTYPFTKWSSGETVYFDECLMTIPPDAPKGLYTVNVGVQTADNQWLSAADSSGTTVAAGYIAVGKLQVN